MAETLYEGPALGAMARVQPGTRLALQRAEHVLSLYDTALIVRVSISFEPGIS